MSDGIDLGHIATRQDFARELTAARERAGKTIRKVASDSGMSPATVGDYFSGAHLPSATSLSAVLPAIGVIAPDEVAAWQAALNRIRRRPGPRPAHTPVPYRGLASYQVEDADWFFGREQLSDLLAARLTGRRASGRPTLLIVGASGSGKSSVIRAGLMPRLASAGFQVVLLTPGEHPLRQFEVQKAALARDSGEPAVIVDQFEEVFTDCADEQERRAFIAELTASEAAVVIGLRADFYARVLAYPELARIAQEGQVVLEPMTRAQLHRVVVEPARKAKVDIEDGLIDSLLRDLRPRYEMPDDGAYETGTLPLLSHALLATWRVGGPMTTARYRETGGINGAVATTAEELYGDLTDVEKDAARVLLLRLTRVTEDGVTRRRVAWADLRTDSVADDVLERLIDKRLVTVSADTVEIAHDALLRAWPRLRTWIDADRTGLRAAHALTDAADAWVAESRDPGALYRGARLAAVREWLSAGHRDELPASAQEFYEASDRRERRRSQAVRVTIAGFAAVCLVAAAAGVVAVRESVRARHERDLAVSRAGAAYANDVRGTDPAIAMQLSLAAYRVAPTTEALSSLLDSSAAPAATRLTGATGTVHAVAFSPDFRLLAAAGADGKVRLWNVTEPNRPIPMGPPLSGGQEVVTTVAFSADGRTLASAGYDRTVRLWDVGVPGHLRPLGEPLAGPADIINSIAFGPDGSTVAAASADAAVHLWNLTDPDGAYAHLRLPAEGGGVNGVAFRPDGAVLASAHSDGAVRLWDTTDRAAPTVMNPLTGATGAVNAVAFSPDGRLLAAGGADMSVRVWPIADPEPPSRPAVALVGPTSRVFAVAFSPDGRTVAAASADESVHVWDATTGRISAVLPHPGPVTAVAFGRDGQTLATGAADGVTRLWALPTPVLGGPERSIFTVAFSPDGQTLAAGSADGTIRLWETADPWRPRASRPPLTAPVGGSPLDGTVSQGAGGRLAAGAADGTVYVWPNIDAGQPLSLHLPPRSAPGAVESVAFSPDGALVASGSATGQVGLWMSTTGVHLATLPTTVGANAFAVTFSPDGQTLAAASADKTVRLWDIRDPAHPVLLGEPLTGPTNYAYHVAFSPDGRTLAASSADGTIHLWDVADPRRPRHIGVPMTGPKGIVYAVAFTPDGHTLATANTDKTVWLWDLADQEHPHVRAVLTGFTHSVFSVAFHPDGRTLAAAGRDAVVRLWNTDPEAVAARICSMAGTPITRTEWAQYLPGRPYNPPC